MLFKEYLQNLSKIQIIQLYTILAILVIFPYMKYIENKVTTYPSNSNLIHVKNNILKINKKLEKPNFFKVLQEFESESKKYKSVQINTFKLNKKSIYLSGVSLQDELLKYLLFCENYSYTSSLNSFSLKPIEKSKLVKFSFNIEFKTKYIKKLSTKELKEQYKQISLLNTKSNNNNFNLQAIVDTFVILDNHLLYVGDSYGKYKIKQINKNNVVLSNNKNTKTLYLQKRDTNVK